MARDNRRPATPDDVLLLRNVFDPQVSPNGRRVAYVVSSVDRESDETRMSVYVAAVDGRQPPRRFTHGKHDHSPRWSPDGRYLAFVSNREEKKGQLFVLPLDGGDARQLTQAKFGVSQPAWSPDGRRIAYAARTGDYKEPKERNPIEKSAPRVVRNLRYKLDGIGFFDERRLHVFTVHVETGETQQITDGDWHDEQPSWSPDGRRIVFVSDRERDRFQRQWRSDVWAVAATGGRARKLTRSKGAAGAPAFSPDGRLVAYVGHEHGDYSAKNTHLMLVPAVGGAAPRSVSASLDRPAVSIPAGRTYAWSRDGRSLLFVAADRGALALYRAGVANGSVSRVLGGDTQIEAFDLTPDGRRAVYVSAWVDEPEELHVAPLSGGRPRRLSDANGELRRSVALHPARRISYRAPDGLEIEAFAVLPAGYRRGRRYPLALLIHGGPHGYFPGGFQLLQQALAGAGYVVLMPNPRGSQAYGEAFAEGCVEDWGGKDFADLMAGVDLLVRRGIADADRLCLGGYSYGGYMTSWAVTQTDRFRAAVVGAPVSDALSAFGEGDIPLFDMYEMGGTPWDKLDFYLERSPIVHLPKVRTPVLLMHWEGDLRCPIGQSEEIFQGLKILGRRVEFVRYPGGSHGVRTPSQWVDYLRRYQGWFDRFAARRPVRRPARRPKVDAPSDDGARPAGRASLVGVRRAGRARAAARRA